MGKIWMLAGLEAVVRSSSEIGSQGTSIPSVGDAQERQCWIGHDADVTSHNLGFANANVNINTGQGQLSRGLLC